MQPPRYYGLCFCLKHARSCEKYPFNTATQLQPINTATQLLQQINTASQLLQHINRATRLLQQIFLM